MDTNTKTNRLAYTSAEVATKLGLSEQTIRRATRSASLNCIRFGRAIRYTDSHIAAYISLHEDVGYVSAD
ncbi:helix-turn-helix domain-containing protein [Cryobacterium sp. M91]|uniref:helix-turn-helix domain-containing protein n=1 Tax=Cryobacterium sp. M91 TaxID=2048294 RepID=UPI000CE4A4D1